MQQIELFPELDTNPHTVVFTFTFDEVEYITAPAQMANYYEDDKPRSTCDGCAFFDEDWLLITNGCQQSEKVCSCMEHDIIWVKKG